MIKKVLIAILTILICLSCSIVTNGTVNDLGLQLMEFYRIAVTNQPILK